MKTNFNVLAKYDMIYRNRIGHLEASLIRGGLSLLMGERTRDSGIKYKGYSVAIFK